MAATLDYDASNDAGTHTHTHEHEHICDENCGPDCGDAAHTDALGGPSSGNTSTGEVDNYTALLYYEQNDSLRWNGQTAVGTQMVVTYSFTDTADLPTLAEYDPYSASGYWSYSETQRDQMRAVMDKYEDVAGVRFVEVQGEGMINIMGADVSGVGGWANVANANSTGVSTGYFVNAYQSQGEGAYGYQVNLHELGHAMGLQHPHEGNIQLTDASDTQANTVMTYNIQNPYATELGSFDVQALQDIYGAADGINDWNVSVDASDVVTIKTTLDMSNDVVVATNVDTRIQAYDGDDEIVGNQGDDTLNGGAGEDTITGSQGGDRLLGRAGDDLLYGDINGSNYSGTANDHDKIYGGSGNDTMYGGRGEDLLNGAMDDDVIYGNYGEDTLRGADGNDTLYGGDGADKLIGGSGADVFVFESYDQNERDIIVDFNSGEDRVDLSYWGFNSISQFNFTQMGDHVLLEYSSWLDIGFLNTDIAELSNSDFIFST